MHNCKKQPLLYSEFAEWWTLLSDPKDYVEEAGIFKEALLSNGNFIPRTLLELGSGGGNNASHLKKHFNITLVDLSPKMLEVSRVLNPECTHLQGDMREIRIGKEFDAVFIHDAIVYMSTRDDLRQAVTTAFIHCRPSGVALFVPDWTAEIFKPSTSHGGHDQGSKGLRYLEWTIDPDPNDNIYSFYMVYLMKDGNTIRQSALDQHECGLFSQVEWLSIISSVGFKAKQIPFNHSTFEKGSRSMFIGIKPHK